MAEESVHHLRPHDAASALLLMCVRSDALDHRRIGQLIQQASVPVLLDHAIYHGLAAWIYRRLAESDRMPPEILDELRPHHRLAAYNHVQGLWELARLQPVLDRTGVAWAVLKGPAVVDLLYGSTGSRHYQDLDLLVDPAGFQTVLQELERAGARLLDRNWKLLRADLRGQLHLVLPRGTPGDLHWDLINVHRRRMQIDTAAVLERIERRDVGGLTLPVLDPTDGLIHLAVHASLSGGDRLIWLKDLELSIAARPPKWEAVIGRAREWHVGRPVGLLLLRTRSVLDADVPDQVIDRLLGSRLRSVASRIDHRWPVHRSRGGPHPGRALSRAIGHGLVGGSSELLGRLLRHFDPREPEASSPFTSAGDQRDRDEFFSAISAAGKRHERTA